MNDKRYTGNVQRGQIALLNAFLECQLALKRFIISRYLHNAQDVEDVLQEAFLRAYDAKPEQSVRAPKAYLFRIARNIALNELNRKSRQITDYIEDFDLPLVIDTGATVEAEVEARQHLGLYCEAIAALPEQCRRVYLLRKVHGLSHKEIAQRMGLTVSSVEKHLLNGTRRCRAYVREREEFAEQRRVPGMQSQSPQAKTI